jgi:DNA repair protein RecN (Recombination protein N)
MLTALRIENFALIDRLELNLLPGLNVLTGETGAGKSIILDALDAALGGTVSGKQVRTGSRKATIEATFSASDALRAWLAAEEIDELEEGLVCSREIGDRTSRSRLNGVLVNKQQLQEVRQLLVEITAQGQTLQLQDATTQRRWLDAYGGDPLAQAREAVRQSFQLWSEASRTLEQRQQEQQHYLQQLDLLEFQHQELEAAGLEQPDELEQLVRERDRLAHSVELQQQSHAVYRLLYQDDADGSAADRLGKAERILTDMCQYDADLASTLAMVNDALIQVEEAGRELSRYAERVETDPERLGDVEERISQLKQLCRKYGPTLADAIAHFDRVAQQLEALRQGGESIEELEAATQQARAELQQACDRLTGLRRQAGDRLQHTLVAELKPLAMGSVQFAVQLDTVAPSAEGSDRITFLISPNPGEPLQPLAAIASGGEMSRVLLALKAVFSQVDPVATLVFDEIDTGVSGKVAQAIAAKLHEISRSHQILCVTHQPLIAAMADSHVQVSKALLKQRTVIRVTPLSEAERRDELAQLAGGHSASEALAFAESLLVQAAQLRSRLA